LAKSARLLLYCLIAWAPLPFGSNRPLFWVVNGIIATAIVALFVAGEIASDRKVAYNLAPVALPLFGMAVWAGWMIVQALPGLSVGLWHPNWTVVAGDLPGVSGAISAAPSTTWAIIAAVAPVVFLAPVAVRLAYDRRRALFLLKLVAGTSVAVATYGMVAQHLGFRQVFLSAVGPDDGVLTGTFVAHNAAAAYFAIGLAASFSLLLAGIERRIAARRRSSQTALDAVDTLWHVRIWLLACLLLGAALLGTGSRGGITAGVVAVLTATFFWGWRTPVGGRTLGTIVVAIGGATAAVVVLSGGTLFQRLEDVASGGDRLLAYQDTIDMILARPLLGHGAGTFTDVFPMFHTRASSTAIWNAAHNSYLQAAAELGLPVFAVIILSIAAVLGFIVSRLARRTEPAPVAIAATAAFAAIAAHSAVDFSVQFQAIGITLIALAGAGLGEAMRLAVARRGATHASPASQTAAALAPASTETIYLTLPFQGQSEAGARLLPVPALSPAYAPAEESANQRLYVFGDLHGRADLIPALKEAIERDRARSGRSSLVIGLGDYIDRGPQSRAVIDSLAAGFGCPSIMLRGNHEQMLLDFLEKPERRGRMWIEHGAVATLKSYGVEVTGHRPNLRELRGRLIAAMPPSHLLFIQRMRTSHQSGRYFFAHAGARPGVPLDQQEPRDLLWIRDGFVDGEHAFEKVVVHAHTQVEKPYLGQFRINLDTAAYISGRLSCLVIDGDDHRLLET
jgi:serine/threonine protein phosphatase 1